jgi:hypothetical protein
MEKLITQTDTLIKKYQALQEFYYSLYIAEMSGELSLSESNNDAEMCIAVYKNYRVKRAIRTTNKFLKLSNHFKEVCRLLNRVKNLLKPRSNLTFSRVKLGNQELNILLNLKDIKRFVDRHNLYKVIDSNYFEIF